MSWQHWAAGVNPPRTPEEIHMPKPKLKPSGARGTRTALQGGVGYAVAEFIDAVIYDMPGYGVALLAVILTAFFSWVQTEVEDYIGKAFLREIPEPDQPVADAAPGERGASDLVTILVCVTLLLVVLIFLGVNVNVR